MRGEMLRLVGLVGPGLGFVAGGARPHGHAVVEALL